MVQSRCHTSFFPHGGFRLRDDTIPQTVLFPDLFNKPLIATFDQPHASSDGGAVLLKAAEARYGLIDDFTRCLVEDRQPGKVRHTLADLLAQRIYGLACGHPDANDADRLADDPIHKLLLGRNPIDGDPLASQPTLSRFENQVGVHELHAMGCELAASVIERHGRRLHGRARTITIDLDPTDDPTHGAQQLTFFNGHYDCWCYLPLLAFVTFNEEVEQYLCAAILRPGNAPATRGARGTLIRLLDLLRQAFPKARFLVRLDGGFATPAILDLLDAEPRLDYVVAMGENAVLTRFAEPTMGLQTGRPSCSRFWANHLRVLLPAAAYVLMQDLRLRAARTACARTQVTGLRERLLKLGVQVVVSVRRIVLHLPTSTPDLDAWCHIARALGARSG